MTVLVDDYVRQVERACADLPDEQRRRIVTDLAAHLRELDIAAGSIYAELGPPEEYARELRAALELPPSPPQYSPARLVRFARRDRPTRVLLIVVAVLAIALVATLIGLAVSGGTSSGQRVPVPAPTARPSPAVLVPDVGGKTEDAARSLLTGRGFEVRVVFVPAKSMSIRGVVEQQHPGPGTATPTGSLVTLQVAN